ncbi:MAG: sigma-54 dependent transcriptional regulator [Candidatus Neomarinimicrobiota bacterium]|nr:sigma-54 dependent transcriptional regulator [Candidatus Neomarinimicrobiota bacterium]MEC7745874.1 sigma-54 dependent transcriptional regulator [Candidatus Neomarinimicrobiota bacterium]|tara:strand:+ start:2238 stop:3464 length:1227 start_codon:yes stop_codon:yes gene_type:complete
MIDGDRLQKQSGIIGTSDGIRQVLDMIGQVAPVNISVLITGESGTGKELVAKAIHQSSKRNNDPLVVVNCGAIPEGIIESELFGHKKGSFTGAGEDRKGYFEEANKGTIFLDEIGETPLETQVKLLRVLESGEFMRVGEAKTRKTDVRIIAATNKDLRDLVKKGGFRQDLYFRLKTVTVHVPALRNRVEDIGPFVERFALEFTRSNDILYRGFMPDAVRVLKQYEWPGNVRELKNFVEKILVLEKGERITAEMVQKELTEVLPLDSTYNPALPVVVSKSSDKAEIDLILRQLFMLKQDTEVIQKMLVSGAISQGDGKQSLSGLNSLEQGGLSIPEKSMEIMEEGYRFIRDDAIGELSIKELEEEAITRTLRFFNNNRRKTARSLGMSERTLYRKIEEFGLEPKIKRRN